MCIFIQNMKFLYLHCKTANQGKVSKWLSFENRESEWQVISTCVHIFIPNIKFLDYLHGHENKSRKSIKLTAFSKLQVRMTKYLMCIFWGQMCIFTPNMKFFFFNPVAMKAAQLWMLMTLPPMALIHDGQIMITWPV